MYKFGTAKWWMPVSTLYQFYKKNSITKTKDVSEATGVGLRRKKAVGAGHRLQPAERCICAKHCSAAER